MFSSGYNPASGADNTKDGLTISVQEATRLVKNQNAVIIDVRTARNWWRSNAKILGADRGDPALVEKWEPKYAYEETLILYCSWKNERTSTRVARYLIKKGHSNVFVLKGGWRVWQKAGYPTEKK